MHGRVSMTRSIKIFFYRQYKNILWYLIEKLLSYEKVERYKRQKDRNKWTTACTTLPRDFIKADYWAGLFVCAGALLILGGLMLNLVASAMLLRPIQIQPAAFPQPSSPNHIRNLPVSLTQTEKDPLENSQKVTPAMSNGITKTGAPSFHRDTLIIENTSLGQRNLQAMELSNLVPNGGHELDSCPVKVCPETNGKLTVNSLVKEKTPTKKAKVLDFSLLKNPFFCIYTWSLVFSQLAYFIPYFHLSARARTLGIDPMDASFIISVAGEYQEIDTGSQHLCNFRIIFPVYHLLL